MINPLVQLAKFTRDLLGVDETTIKLGRQNFEDLTLSDDLIIVDSINYSRQASMKKFDSDAEEMTHTTNQLGDFTINFYGSSAFENVTLFDTLKNSQAAWELQRSYGITVYNDTTITNLKQLTGKRYNERYELGLKVRFNFSTTIETLRIDSADITFLNDK